MKKILTLTLLLLLLHNLNAQTTHDSVFNNVILIEKTDVTTNGNDFLIDIPIKPQKESIIIFNNDERIPIKLFLSRKSFLYEQNEILLITPDWEYYKSIRETEKKTGYHLHPYRQSKFYHIQRNNTGHKVDSLSIIMDKPDKPIALNFKKPELKEGEVKYYYSECYGSICCPHDSRWIYSETIENDIKLFEKKYNVLVTNDIKTLRRGKEGEKCNNYPLINLTNEQKLQFFQIFKEADKLRTKIYVPIIDR